LPHASRRQCRYRTPPHRIDRPAAFAPSTATCPDAQFHPNVPLLANATYEACPTELINAPVDVVWRLPTHLSGWGDFYDVRVKRVDGG
jgi:hypothetical protein